MLFKNNTMSLVTDLNMVTNVIQDTDFVIVAAITDSINFGMSNIYNAGILMPPTDVLMSWADGDQLSMQNRYPYYLMSCKEADDMIMALLAALTKKNVIIYIPRDEYNIFGVYFLNHMHYTYGITMNTPMTQFSFDISKLPFILCKFYIMDLMSGQDFIASYPKNAQIIPFVMDKLIAEFRPFNVPTSYQDYANYFNNLVRSSELINPIKIIDKCEVNQQ